MPLVVSGLETSLRGVFSGDEGFPENAQQAGQRWAKAYRQYAGGASAGATTPLAASLSAAETALAQALGAAFAASQQAGTAKAAADSLALAFVAFWSTPPMAFVVPQPPVAPTMAGVVTLALPVPLSGSLLPALASGAADGSPSAPKQAAALAAALDAWTHTVMVTNTPITPPGPPILVPLA